MPKTFIYISLGMSLFFMAAGIFIVVNPAVFGEDGGNMPYLFAAGIFAYGVFRMTRAVKWLKASNDQMAANSGGNSGNNSSENYSNNGSGENEGGNGEANTDSK